MRAEENATENNDPLVPNVSSEDTPSEAYALGESPTLLPLSESVALATQDATATHTSPIEITEAEPIQEMVEVKPIQEMVEVKPAQETVEAAPVQVLERSSQVTHRENMGELVPIEPLGNGIVHALSDAVGQVVQTALSIQKIITTDKTSTTKKEQKKEQKKPSSGLGRGAQSFVSSMGEITQNGVDIVTGLAGCLQESFRCMGKIIMNPSKKTVRKTRQKEPTRKNTAQKKAPQNVLTHTPLT